MKQQYLHADSETNAEFERRGSLESSVPVVVVDTVTNAAAPAPSLDPEADRYIAELLDRAMHRLKKRDGETKRLLTAFTSGRYDHAQYHQLLSMLRSRRTGNQWAETVCIWLAGIATIKAEDRAAVVNELTALVAAGVTEKFYNPPRWLPRATQGLLIICFAAGFVSGLVLCSEPIVDAIGHRDAQALINGLISVSTVCLFGGLAYMLCTLPFFVLFVALDQSRQWIPRPNGLAVLAAHSLGRIGDIRAIPALCTAVRRKRGVGHLVAVNALRRLLIVAASHEEAETDGSLGLYDTIASAVCRLITNVESQRLLRNQQLYYSLFMEALGALERIGGKSASRPLELLARQLPTDRLRDRAARALAVVTERNARLQERGLLLRGAQRPAEGSKALLRPSAKAPESSPQELLRAAEPGALNYSAPVTQSETGEAKGNGAP